MGEQPHEYERTYEMLTPEEKKDRRFHNMMQKRYNKWMAEEKAEEKWKREHPLRTFIFAWTGFFGR